MTELAVTVSVHPSADVSPKATIGDGTRIWHQAQVREGARIGRNCIIGKAVYIDFDVVVGDNVKIQNGALLYHGLTVEDGVFIGPQACMTNDLYPRAITPQGDLKGADDWTVGPTLLRAGASVGACSVILPNVTIGRFALVAAGAVVTRSAPDQALMVGVPARLVGYACVCGHRMQPASETWRCPDCGRTFIPGEQ